MSRAYIYTLDLCIQTVIMMIPVRKFRLPAGVIVIVIVVKCQPCTTQTAPAPTNAQKTDRHIIYKKGLKDSPQWRENSNSIRERDMSVSIDAEKRRQTWRESGVSSQGVNGLGENGAKWGQQIQGWHLTIMIQHLTCFSGLPTDCSVF